MYTYDTTFCLKPNITTTKKHFKKGKLKLVSFSNIKFDK